MAKARGAYRGRKRSLTEEQSQQLRQRAGAGEAKTILAREFGISRETVYQYLRARQSDMEPAALNAAADSA